MTTPDLKPLADFVASCRVDARDAALSVRLRNTLLDWSSALLAGTGHPLADPYRAALLVDGETGSCSVVATPGRHPTASAAAANAAISHLWEVDDSHRDSTTHPGITVIPVVMALAERHKLGASTVAAAIVAGFEAVIRIGSHLGAAHYKTCHSTATAGTFGATAAAARALGLDGAQTLSAFGHAGTQAAGLWAFLDDGRDAAKAFHASTATRNGLAAVKLVEAGICGADTVLEAPRGLRAALGLEGCDPSWPIPTETPMIHTITVKGWPVCGQMHSALDCAQALFEAHPELTASDVPVTVMVPQSAVDIAGRRDPGTVSEAKFSTSFCIAATLCGRPPTIAGLTEVLVHDPEVRTRAQKVEVRAFAEFTDRFPKERPACVTLHATAGDMSEERSFRKGDPEARWSISDMEKRSSEVLALASLPVDAAALIAWCDAFAAGSEAWNAVDLFDIIGSGAPHREFETT